MQCKEVRRQTMVSFHRTRHHPRPSSQAGKVKQIIIIIEPSGAKTWNLPEPNMEPSKASVTDGTDGTDGTGGTGGNGRTKRDWTDDDRQTADGRRTDDPRTKARPSRPPPYLMYTFRLRPSAPPVLAISFPIRRPFRGLGRTHLEQRHTPPPALTKSFTGLF